MFKDIAIYVCFLAIIASTGECQRTRSPTTKTTSSPVSENVPVVSDSTIALDQVSSTTVASTTPKPKPTPLRFFSSLGNSQYLGMPGKTSYKEYYMSEVQMIWPSAVLFCEHFGLQLAHLATHNETNELFDLLEERTLPAENNDTPIHLFVGATDQNSDNEWYWIFDGKNIDYPIKWLFNGKPDPAPSANCLVIVRKYNLLHFNNQKCDKKAHFVCEVNKKSRVYTEK